MGIVTRGDSPSSYDETGDAGKQWYSCRNVGSKDIPPYSIVQLKTETGSSFRAQDVENQQVVWLVQQCTDEGASSGNPALFAFTGPYKIAKGGYGRVTWSFPVQVVHDGKHDRLPNGVLCGPRAGTWEVWSTGRGFVCLCHDMAKAVWENGKHTVWVAPSPVSVESYGRFYMPDGHVAGLAWIDLQARQESEYVNSALPQLVCNLNPPQPTSFTSGSDTLRGLAIPFDGRYHFDLSATVYSADLDHPGIYLGFSVSMWRKATKATVTARFRILFPTMTPSRRPLGVSAAARPTWARCSLATRSDAAGKGACVRAAAPPRWCTRQQLARVDGWIP
jgi:hypothetical protein